MKTTKSILIAFILNLAFSVFELAGGLYTGSVAILSDALHDLGDAMSIGVSFFLERKSTYKPDAIHTYGYARYSVLGGLITTAILLAGSVVVIGSAVVRIANPVSIRYDSMILLALIGVAVNMGAAYFTRHGDSLNQKAVNLHMLEDVLGWLVVLVGAIVMRFTDFALIDPILSIAVSVYIVFHALKNLKEIGDLFLVKTPQDICVEEIREHLCHIPGVQEVHHIHIWSLDGRRNLATMHVVAQGDAHSIKDALRQELAEHGIDHATLELEAPGEHCHYTDCVPPATQLGHHHHHHHHHHA